MPFRKLRSLQEAEESVWMDRDDPGLFQRIRSLWDFAFRLAPRHFPPGVYKFRSIQEKNSFDEARRSANVRAQQSRIASREGVTR